MDLNVILIIERTLQTTQPEEEDAPPFNGAACVELSLPVNPKLHKEGQGYFPPCIITQ